jgi:hypothetical protein
MVDAELVEERGAAAFWELTSELLCRDDVPTPLLVPGLDSRDRLDGV